VLVTSFFGPFDYTYVYASRTQPSTWTGGQYLDASGNFNLGVLASGSVGTVNSYNIAIYASSALNDVSNLAGSASTKTDEIIAYDYGVSDSWLNTGAPETLYSRLKYASDNAEISSGTFTWNGVEMEFNGSYWTNKYTLPIQTQPLLSIIQLLLSQAKEYQVSRVVPLSLSYGTESMSVIIGSSECPT